MPCPPPASSALLVPPARAPQPGKGLLCALRREPSSSRSESFVSLIQPAYAKRLDGTLRLDSTRAQRWLGKPTTTPSNRLIVSWSQCLLSCRTGDQHELQQSPASYPPHVMVAERGVTLEVRNN